VALGVGAHYLPGSLRCRVLSLVASGTLAAAESQCGRQVAARSRASGPAASRTLVMVAALFTRLSARDIGDASNLSPSPRVAGNRQRKARCQHRQAPYQETGRANRPEDSEHAQEDSGAGDHAGKTAGDVMSSLWGRNASRPNHCVSAGWTQRTGTTRGRALSHCDHTTSRGYG
jgi:hypothetical protein